ncbi:hypothetical protein [Flavihumibacter sp. UBA7668]|uniref:hypothetical protein n=1 Tax=Flavihumibacter sp. UBA7668 TaxID=1946542 RepID=UPI0025BB3BC1|nr:hypothetical protein [Flavihumibacter sp. UBA7668]
MFRLIALLTALTCFSGTLPAQTFTAGQLKISLNDSGAVTALKTNSAGQDYSVAEPGLLLQLVVGGVRLRPEKIRVSRNQIQLSYAQKKQATLQLTPKPNYLRLELTAISEGVDAVVWGPINNSIADTIGNAVGVVRNKNFAIGIQCLNPKTTGGELINEEGAVFDLGTTAVAKPFGSSLQAFTINRLKDRTIKVWDRWPNVPVKGIKEGSLTGSAIALFGCANAEVLPVIQQIAKDNKMPYTLWQNEWIKTAAETGRPYMITTFNEKNIDTFIQYAVRMGLAGVYHEDPFETWGHFQLKKELFPNGRKGFKACVDKAHAAGLRLGFHTLTTFLTTNDAYITPVPDKRLAKAGGASLAAAIGADDTELTVTDKGSFTMKSDLNCVQIGDELIRFTAVSETAPYVLSGCLRGAFGTKKASHAAGAIANRLIDHPYQVLFPDWDLQKEIASNIAAFINETGADQMDFDGHEGTYSTGMGDLSFNQFAEDVFRQSKHPVVMGSSRANHYFWHMNNYLNWGEPWYGGFRESQSDVRINYQKFHSSNYMPNMLGWFLITATTGPDDIDWMLARAAGYSAGYALVIRENALGNPAMNAIIEKMNQWTKAQRSGLFSSAQKEWLKNPANEARISFRNNTYYLEKFRQNIFEHQVRQLQPGEPSRISWDFENPSQEQAPQIQLLVKGEEGKLEKPVIELDQLFRLELPVTINAGESLVIGKDGIATLYNRKGQQLKKIELSKPLPVLKPGNHSLGFDGGRLVHTESRVLITLTLSERTEALAAGN